MENELLNQIRHECRNAVTSIQHEIHRLAEIENIMRQAILGIAKEQVRIEKAINFLDNLERQEDEQSKRV